MNNYHLSASALSKEVNLDKNEQNCKYISFLNEVIKVIDDNQFDLEFAFSFILQNKQFFDEVQSDICFNIIKHKIIE